MPVATTMHPDDDHRGFEEADRRIAEALGRLPWPEVHGDLPSRVLARVGRRRVVLRAGALASAAVVLLLGWTVWPPQHDDAGNSVRGSGVPGSGVPGSGVRGHSIVEKAGQAALVAQWEELLDEAAALPSVVVDLKILETQRAWVATLQDRRAVESKVLER